MPLLLLRYGTEGHGESCWRFYAMGSEQTLKGAGRSCGFVVRGAPPFSSLDHVGGRSKCKKFHMGPQTFDENVSKSCVLG